MYTDTHRYFIQYMLKHPCIKQENAIKIYNEIATDEGEVKTNNELKNLINEINQKIAINELRLSTIECEITDESYLILMNLIRDGVSQAQKTFEIVHLEYFNTIMMEIITGDSRVLKNNVVLNLASHLTKRLSRQDAEKLLTKWHEGGYFLMKDGNVYLGPRCVLEYCNFFRQECKDYIQLCNLCSEVVLMGATCNSCDKLMHRKCINTYLSRRPMCPNCDKKWVEAGEDAPQNTENNSSDSDDTPDATPVKRNRK